MWRGQPGGRNPIVYEVKLNYDYFNYVVANSLNVDNTVPSNPVATAAMAPRSTCRPARPLPPGPGGQTPQSSTTGPQRAVTAFPGDQQYLQRSNNRCSRRFRRCRDPIQVKAAWMKLGGANAKPSDFPTWHTAFAQNYIR